VAAVWRYGVKPGEAYVVFGAEEFPVLSKVDDLDGSNGFRITGFQNAVSVSATAAGDINGDGFADLFIAEGQYDAFYLRQNAFGYIIFGREQFDHIVDAQSLNGSNGFKIYPAENGLEAIVSITSVGDTNGDGLEDFVFSVEQEDFGLNVHKTYVVYGHTGAFSASLNLEAMGQNQGYLLEGVSGQVSSAGDVNKDGADDLLVGGGENSESYLIYGARTTPFASNGDGLDNLLIGGLPGTA
jgi:hypothetical protein